MVEVRFGFGLGFLFLLCSLVFGEGENGNQTLRLGAERVALIELRSSLGLRGKNWPIKADPCLLWKGIECEDGRVVGINISGFRRTRIGRRNPQFAIDSLVNLTMLASFNASRFALPGEIPEWFGLRMQSLEVLDLSSCGVRGNGVGPVPTGGNLPPSNAGASVDFSRVGDSYTYQQLLQATSEFNDSNLVKHGHTGDLYHGVLEGGIPVVVKKIDLQSIKNDGHLVELDFFSKVSHIRMVPLLGHCLENENEKLLVYKYMRNGDLSNALFRKTNQDDDGLQSLDWITRLKIAIGAAEGLSYLHHECTPPLVHRDVQASSILLDDKFEVRLGSLSEVCAQEVDPHQSRFTRFMRLPQTSEPLVFDYNCTCLVKEMTEFLKCRVLLDNDFMSPAHIYN